MQRFQDTSQGVDLSSISSAETSSTETEISLEQRHIDRLYGRLDALRDRADARLAEVLITPTVETDQAVSHREDFAAAHRLQGVRLDNVERGLCFGRIDLDATEEGGENSERRYIGRLGLLDENYDSLLVDWRAPAAQPFYRATYAERHGVVRRRHIHTRGRTVTGLDDEVLDLEALDDVERTHLMGEAALLASLESGRTGRMADIVSTIQAEQDRIIRSDLGGILVVEGGPGTGKTVVALHRAAYLLYNHRNLLSRRGVLVLGPNATFMRYIDQVLPSLGETDVVLATIGELYPGVATSLADPPASAVVKGDLRMVDVVAEAVRVKQWVPQDGLEVRTSDGDVLHLDWMTCFRAREHARRTELVHNRARTFLVKEILDTLTEGFVEQMNQKMYVPDAPELDDAEREMLEPDEFDAAGEPGDEQEYGGFIDVEALRRNLATDPNVHEVLDRLWPELTPQGLLAELYSDPALLASAAPNLGVDERKALLRDDPRAWTVGDVPLLDEIALLVGETDLAKFTSAKAAEYARGEAEAAEQYARNISQEMEESGWSSDDEDEQFFVRDTDLIAERYSERVVDGSVADRALLDREWEFAYAIIDEAQELSPMAWRLVVRRVPGKSMTVVGDVAQTGSAEGVDSWAETLDGFADGRWRRERLSVNYRTPAEIMNVAREFLAATAPHASAPDSVRDGGDPPWAERIDVLQGFAAVVRREAQRLGDGKLAVIAAPSLLDEVARGVRSVVPDALTARDRRMLDATVAVLTPGQAKGLEFDSVVVVEPERILADSDRGAADLYVALTRATRRLGVVHAGEMPVSLRSVLPTAP